MYTFVAPQRVRFDGHKVFLAGGITDCDNWQKVVINNLSDRLPKTFAVCNPRRDNFPIHIRGEADRQIAWEFDQLETCDIFSMFFANSDSVQPICFYELGRNICRMQERFPNDWWNRIVISCESGFKRVTDVLIQVRLATKGNISVNTEFSATEHANEIARLCERLSQFDLHEF